MAQRRMFSKTITNSGKFLKMPPTSRLLYYDLGMNADDDGYTEWFTIVRMSGSTEQDLQVLQANGFIKIFDENVLVILDWKENNFIRTDRYTPSKYIEVYRLETKCTPVGIPTVDPGKDRLDQDRLSKKILLSNSPVAGVVGQTSSNTFPNTKALDPVKLVEFEKFWEVYPKKEGKKKSAALFSKIKGDFLPKIIPALKAQILSKNWTKENYQFIPQPETWLRGERWNDEVTEPSRQQTMEAYAREMVLKHGENNGMFYFTHQTGYTNDDIMKLKHIFHFGEN